MVFFAIEENGKRNLSDAVLVTAFIILLAAPLVFTAASSASSPVFSAAFNISNDLGVARYPNVANSGDQVYVSWTEGGRGVFFRASSDGGSTWNPPISSQAMKISPSVGTTQRPWMSANGSNVYIVWSQTPKAARPCKSILIPVRIMARASELRRLLIRTLP